ncbi:MAG: NAD+ synthase [Bacteroidetes bacterium]|nr:NAD+ synthase [Bacteroidota bacterium]
MKIALAQINYHIGNFDSNVTKIKQAIRKSREKNADLVVFAELAVSGYPPRDFLEFDDYIEQCHRCVLDVASVCTDIAAIVGSPSINPDKKGKRLHNSAYFLQDGKVKAVTHKTLLPNYDVFDEYRYFEPFKDIKVIDFKDHKIALTICEDIWDISDSPLYTVSPMEVLSGQHPDLMINIAASPFHYEQALRRKQVLGGNAKKYHMPLFYVNHVGAQTELLFDGGSMVVGDDGEVVDEMNYFEEDLRIYECDRSSDGYKINLVSDEKKEQRDTSKIALIHDALIMGIRNYFEKLGLKKALLGLSGGIDSAVTLVLAQRALGKENVRGVMLPSRYSSYHSLSDAIKLAENLGVSFDIIGIEESFNSIEETLKPNFKDLPFDITEENMQARIRAIILMALSNKFGYILLNTSNKSEAAVGYGTLYGDMCGGISVLGDVYKTDVFGLARYINKDYEVIPENTINKPPSAELRPDQKDADSLPDYEILDRILYQYIELRQGPDDLIKQGFDEVMVRTVLRLVNSNEFKRHQAPPILRVSPKAFGMGRRMPIVAKYLS